MTDPPATVTTDPDPDPFDLVVVGSGFGGALAARAAVLADRRVAMIERGDWVRRGPENWGPQGFAELGDAWSREAPYEVVAGGTGPTLGMLACVGGAGVFFGGVTLRLREADFAALPGRPETAWPYAYADLEPYYAEAERLLGVAGRAGEDPTEPWRSGPYPHEPDALAPISARLARAARDLGLRPFQLPLAIHYAPGAGVGACVRCGTCDGFACAVSAKGDTATAVVPDLARRGLSLFVNTVAVALVREGRRVTEVACVDRHTGAPRRIRGRAFVVAAGALATPHLLLASGLDAANPAGAAIGRHLMRHCNGIVMGVFPFRPAPDGAFHKQIGIHDRYTGRLPGEPGERTLGCIQQFGTPQGDYIRRYLPAGLRTPGAWAIRFTTGLIVIAEDWPQAANGVALGAGRRTRFGQPQATVTHRYQPGDLAARAVLAREARRILRRGGALARVGYDIRTFSHAVGTVRMGRTPETAPLDEWGAFRGLDNLWVADGSVFPRSGGVNPSLTIAANALRTGARVAGAL